MAHPRIIASRQAIAVQRLMAAANGIAKRHGLKKQGEALTAAVARDPSMAQMLQSEALADLLEALTGSIGMPEPPPVATPIPDDAVGNVTVETVEEEPLVTTETVSIVPTVSGFGVPRSKRR